MHTTPPHPTATLLELDVAIDVCEAKVLARRERGDEHAQATDAFQGGHLACSHYGEPAADKRLADHAARARASGEAPPGAGDRTLLLPVRSTVRARRSLTRKDRS